MNKFQTHQTKHSICTNYLEVTDGHLLAVEDQLLLKALKPRLDKLLREPSEDVLCTIMAYTELL
ncbi:MAG: hypothetical protein K9H63_03330 [Sphingobacteriaceae bacterium]|nr:hypothetical protein [Sphingobacteriaceae bacterium]